MRIVSLVPSITEAVAQLDAGDTLVGVTDYCLYPKDVVAQATRIGGTKDPDLAAIRALRPDLVIANTDEQRAATLEALEAEPYDVLVTDTDDLDAVAETWLALGRALDREDAAAREHERLQEARANARAATRDLPPLATLVPVWRAPWMAAGGGTYLGDLLAHCGFQNLLEALEGKWLRFEPSTDPEQARAATTDKGPFAGQTVHPLPRVPDVVLLPTEPYAFEEADRDRFAALGCPRARVHVVDGELLTWWLSRTVPALGHFTTLRRSLA